MNKLILFAGIVACLGWSCKKVALEPDPTGEEGKPVAEALIGPEGGSLSTGDFMLRVPEGALETSMALELYLDEEDPISLGNQVTASYSLSGLNKPWGKSLEIAVRYQGSSVEQAHLAFSIPYFNEESGDTVQVSALLEAADSSGFLRCVLPPVRDPETGFKSTELSYSIFYFITKFQRIKIYGLEKVSTYWSDYAEIRYDKSVEQSKVIRLGQELDEAVALFHTMGLLDASKLSGKLRLFVEILEQDNPEAYPTYYRPDFHAIKDFHELGQEYFTTAVLTTYKLKIPVRYFLSAEDKVLRRIAGRAVFEFGDYCRFPDRTNWFYFAFRNWTKEYFSGTPSFAPSESVFMHPLRGLNTLKMDKYEHLFPGEYGLKKQLFHGEAFTPLFTYLMDHQNPDLDLMGRIYDEMAGEGAYEQPITALLEAVPEAEHIWWPGFVRAYLEGDVRDIPAEDFMDGIDAGDHLHFMDKTDTLKYFDRAYPDLSAKLCQVNLSQDLLESVLQDQDGLEFKLGPQSLNMDYVEVQVYAYQDGKLNYLGRGQEVTLEDLKGLMENGLRTLLAVVVNSASEAPYKEELDIQLTVKLLKKKTWPWTYLAVQVVVNEALFRADDGSATTWEEFRFKIEDREMEVSEDGTLFTAGWLEESSGYKYEGGMEITLDPESFDMTSFYLWSNTESLSGDQITLAERTDIQSAEGVVVPFVFSDASYAFHQLEQAAVCPAIGDYSYVHCYYPGQEYELKNILESYSCLQDAELVFYWSDTPSGILTVLR